LPFTTLKVDRSFVQDLSESAYFGRMIEMFVTLAHSLDIRVVAEGIETANEYQAIQELGCDEAQGFFLGRPDSRPERLLPGSCPNISDDLVRLNTVLADSDSIPFGEKPRRF
jgi:EAL domain-containing protein (putative c-di-GMP-specific phosphodiesterase class I)